MIVLTSKSLTAIQCVWNKDDVLLCDNIYDTASRHAAFCHTQNAVSNIYQWRVL